MAMQMVSTVAGMRDLMALAREIEATEHVTRREALLMALHQWDEITAMCAGDCRYLPVGWAIQPHVSWSAPMHRLDTEDRDVTGLAGLWDTSDTFVALGRLPL